MDSDRFDGLTRSFSMFLSRRALAGVLGLGTLGLPGLADAKKRHKHKKKKCKGGTKKCGKACIPGDACCPVCPRGQTCLINGSCATNCDGSIEPCPSCIGCSSPNTEGDMLCIPADFSCGESHACSSTSQCPVGQACMTTFCGPGGTDATWCYPLCNG
jgi:hypothetical protein